MPWDGAQNYQYPPGTPGIPDQTIESESYNTFLDDLVINDLNKERPIHRGGTGATTAVQALANLGGEKAQQVITNYDQAGSAWLSGSFYSAGSATAPPVAGHAFIGFVTKQDDNNMVLEAFDLDSTPPGESYTRIKKAGVWQSGGAWGSGGYVRKTGDEMSGALTIKMAQPWIRLIDTNLNPVNMWAGIIFDNGGTSGTGPIQAAYSISSYPESFQIDRYPIAGGAVNGTLAINRADGLLTNRGDINIVNPGATLSTLMFDGIKALQRDDSSAGITYMVMWSGGTGQSGSIWVGEGADNANYYMNGLPGVAAQGHLFGPWQGATYTSIGPQKVEIKQTTEATGLTDGALNVAGGAAINKQLLVGGTAFFRNPLWVQPLTGSAQVLFDAATAADQSTIIFAAATAGKWQLGRQGGDNSFFIYDIVGGTTVFGIASAGTDITFHRPFNTVGENKFRYSGTGAGAWYDSFNTANRFYVGSDGGSDHWRVFTPGSGQNALTINGATGAAVFAAGLTVGGAAGLTVSTGPFNIANGATIGGSLVVNGASITTAGTIGLNGGSLTIAGTTTPYIIFGPSSGHTVNAQIFQQGDFLIFGKVGTLWCTLNLNTGLLQTTADMSADRYLLNNVLFARQEGVYTRIFDNAGVSAIAIGNATDPTTYFKNTGYEFQPRAGGSPWVTINATQTKINQTTGSSSKDTGALVVEGGVGIEENLHVGSNASIFGTLAAATINAGAGGVNGAGARKSAFHVHKNAVDQTGIADNTWTQVTFSTEAIDTGNNFASNAWTPPAGPVFLSAMVAMTGTVSGAGSMCYLAIYKNGSAIAKNAGSMTAAGVGGASVATYDVCNGSDVYTCWGLIDTSSGTGTFVGVWPNSQFCGMALV